jgi:hypothetical protein
MIQALLYYIVNVYPEAVMHCKLMDALSQDIMKGGICNDHWLDSETLEKLGSYIQNEENERNDFNENWVSVETSADMIGTLFS